MSIEHKAFIFDYTEFSNELKPLLEQCLTSGEICLLKEFIITNKSYLRDPYEGEDLDGNWEDLIEDKDPHQYGDFALTKYYFPQNDRGLGVEWEDIKNAVDLNHKGVYSPLLGVPLGVEEGYFDPGKTGSYFQSVDQVAKSLKILEIVQIKELEAMTILDEFKKLLGEALSERKGIYVTF